MAGFKHTLLFSVATFLLVGCPADTQSFFGLQLSERTLSNGLRLVAIQKPESPIVSFQTWYHVGSSDELPGATGLAHLFEHLYFKGNGDLEAKGAEVGAYTTRDLTVFHSEFVPQLFGEVLERESRRMAAIAWDEKSIEAEKWVILEERLLRLESSPEVRLQEALWSHAFERHPYAWPVMGIPQDLAQVQIETIREFYQRFYRPSNAVIVVVGPESPKEVLTRLASAYQALPKQELPERTRFVEPEQKEERRFKIHDATLSAVHMGFAYPIPSAHGQDAHALDVLAQILFGTDGSRAQRLLVRDHPLALSVEGVAYTPEQPGLFLVTAILRQGVKPTDFEDALQKMFEGISTQGVSEAEVESVVKQLTLQLMESARTPYGLGQFIGTVETLFDDSERFATDLSRYRAVQPADVRRVAEKYFGLNQRTVVEMSR